MAYRSIITILFVGFVQCSSREEEKCEPYTPCDEKPYTVTFAKDSGSDPWADFLPNDGGVE